MNLCSQQAAMATSRCTMPPRLAN